MPFTFTDAAAIVGRPDTRFSELLTAANRIDAAFRAPRQPETPAQVAAAFKALARGVLIGMRAHRAGFAPHMMRATVRRSHVASLALAAMYRRKAIVSGMLAASLESEVA